MIKVVSRYPFLTSLVIVLGGFFIYAAFLIISRVIVDPAHVVVTAYGVEGKKDDGKVALTINRVSYHPATKVRGLFTRQSNVTARPEYIQVDGTIASSAGFSGVMALVGPALIPVESEGKVEREIRTRGNPCLPYGWPSMALQLNAKPSDFTIRIPISGDLHAARLLASIKKGQMPPITIKGIYMTIQKCELIGVMMATKPHEITVDAISLGSGVLQDFYPYGLPRFSEPGGAKREYWKEWARGWVPGEF